MEHGEAVASFAQTACNLRREGEVCSAGQGRDDRKRQLLVENPNAAPLKRGVLIGSVVEAALNS